MGCTPGKTRRQGAFGFLPPGRKEGSKKHADHPRQGVKKGMPINIDDLLSFPRTESAVATHTTGDTVLFVVGDEASDGPDEVGKAAKRSPLMASRPVKANQRSTWLSHEAEVGVS